MNDKVVSLARIKYEKCYKNMGMGFSYNAALDIIHNRSTRKQKNVTKDLRLGYMKLLSNYKGVNK